MTSEKCTESSQGIVARLRSHKKLVGNLFSSVVATIAVIISLLSYCVTEQSLDLARDQFQYAIADRIFVDGEWENASLFLDEFQESSVYKSLDGISYYTGLSAFVRFKLANASQHPLTIDFLNVGYLAGSSAGSIPASKTFFRQDSLIPMDFPITLQPSEQITAGKVVPVPVSKEVYLALKDLPRQSKLEMETVRGALVSFNQRHSNAFGNSSNDTSWFSKMTTAWVTEPSHIPELLLTISDDSWTVRRNERSLEIAIRLSSGKIIFDTLDYIDLNRSVIEF